MDDKKMVRIILNKVERLQAHDNSKTNEPISASAGYGNTSRNNQKRGAKEISKKKLKQKSQDYNTALI